MRGHRNHSDEDIQEKFGYHKGSHSSTPVHQEIRQAYIDFVKVLDEHLIPGVNKEIVFIRLEEAAMWSHKSISEQDPVAWQQR